MSVSLGVWHLSRVLRAGKVRGLTEALHVVRRLRRARGAELYECEAELLRAAELSFAAIARNGVEPHVRAQRVDAELLAQEMDRSRLGAIRIDVSECAGISDEVKSWLLANVWSAVVD
jgi:hypothetical protein